MIEPVVYFIEDASTGHIKIGHSTSVWARFSQLQCSCPGELTLLGVLPGDLALEARVHAKFASARLRGEWFKRTPELTAFIVDVNPLEKTPTKSRAFWNGMSDGEVSAGADLCKAMATHIRLGRRRPSPEVAMRLQRLTGVSAVALVFGDDAEEALRAAA